MKIFILTKVSMPRKERRKKRKKKRTSFDLNLFHIPLSTTEAADIIGKENAETVARSALALYTKARDFAAEKGVIIADTKFEFGVDESGKVILADEVLTPDSSRFWPAEEYEIGRGQNSFDKQYVRDYLTSVNFDMKTGIELPEDVVQRTLGKYVEVFRILTGKDPVL
jgi:phosphoribosylaminoimidazole-succinocarboxamide synthase